MPVKTLLVLAAGPLQTPAITTAKRLGLRVVAVDGDPRAPGLALADVAYARDLTDPEACLEVARSERIDGVIHICSEVALQSMGLVNHEMGLHGPGPQAVMRATNKVLMRRSFEQAGAPSPKFFEVLTFDEARAAQSALPGPAVVKPARNSGSRGIAFLATGASDHDVAIAFRRALSESRDSAVVVEQYVDGPEFSVEALTWNGHIEVLAVTDKVTSGRPHFVELGHSQPTQLDEKSAALVCEAAVQGIHALDLDWCAIHAEVRLTDDGPYLVEIGARLGGDLITTELVPRSSGVDMVAAAIRIALGEEPDLAPAHPPRGAAIRYLAPQQGIVERVEGLDHAQGMTGVEIASVYVEPGDQVGEMDSSLARIGHVIAEGRTADEAIRNAGRARDAISVRYRGKSAPAD